MTAGEYLTHFKTDFSDPVDLCSMAVSIAAQALDLYQLGTAPLRKPAPNMCWTTLPLKRGRS
jgi:hypothetical protein